MKKSAQGDLYAIFCAVTSGFSLISAKVAVSIISSETLTFYLFVFAFGFTLFPLFWKSQRLIISQVNRDQLVLIMKLAVLFSAGIFLAWKALEFLEPATQSFLSRTKLLMTLLFAVFFLKERLYRLEIIGGLVAATGILLLKFNAGPEVSSGATLMIMSAFLLATAEIMLKRAINKIRPMLFLFYRNLAMMPCFAVIIWLRGESFVIPDLYTAGLIAITALLAPIAARGLYILAIRRNSLSRTVLLNQTQPLFAALAGFAFLGSFPTPVEWAGGGLILVGAFIIRAKKRDVD